MSKDSSSEVDRARVIRQCAPKMTLSLNKLITLRPTCLYVRSGLSISNCGNELRWKTARDYFKGFLAVRPYGCQDSVEFVTSSLGIAGE